MGFLFLSTPARSRNNLSEQRYLLSISLALNHMEQESKVTSNSVKTVQWLDKESNKIFNS